MISSLAVDTIYREHNRRMIHSRNPALLAMYTHGIEQNGSPLHNCFGFIDGTLQANLSIRPIPEDCVQWA